MYALDVMNTQIMLKENEAALLSMDKTFFFSANGHLTQCSSFEF